MEGSVKNLLEAENEAKLIVEEAQNERNKLMQDANVKAAQEVNERRKQWEQKLQDEAEKVSQTITAPNRECSFAKREKKSTGCSKGVPSSSKRLTNNTPTTRTKWYSSCWTRSCRCSWRSLAW